MTSSTDDPEFTPVAQFDRLPDGTLPALEPPVRRVISLKVGRVSGCPKQLVLLVEYDHGQPRPPDMKPLQIALAMGALEAKLLAIELEVQAKQM